MERADLLIHPVRIRIVHALTGQRILTAHDLHELLTDVSLASLYRQLALLVDGGILEVVAERRNRGTVERSYQLSVDRPPVDAETVASATPNDHRRAFTIAVTTLLSEFGAYLDRPDAAPMNDLVGYQQMSLWLSHEELAEFLTQLGRLITAVRAQQPEPGRERYLFSPVIFPTERTKN
ncbi:helix-turn-helix domain-containing protein [Microbacterium sp. X-17]|uniref:helix-turn-helix domain-containing protein n=1 Tax=Microbacterium sp. X-17 TaxID=3144404 RepID=UPI0031F54AB0